MLVNVPVKVTDPPASVASKMLSAVTGSIANTVVVISGGVTSRVTVTSASATSTLPCASTASA